MDIIYKKDNLVLEIENDEFNDSPREWSNLGKMVCYHSKYMLPNELDVDFSELGTWSAIEDYLVKEENAEVILRIYMYDHSGVTIRTTPFSCGWDSGTIGVIVARREDILENFGKKRMSNKLRERVKEVLKAEVETYSQYMEGDTYTYTLYKLTKCECCGNTEKESIDSCGGFYGDDFKYNGLFENAGIKDISEWEEIDC